MAIEFKACGATVDERVFMLMAIFALLALLALSATLPAFLAMRGKAGTRKLLLLPPILGAVAVGLFASIYMALFGSNALATVYWLAPLTLAAWVMGALFCAVLTVGANIGRSRPRSRSER